MGIFSSDLTPQFAGVVWLFRISPFPNSLRRVGGFSVEYNSKKSPHSENPLTPLQKGKGSERGLYELNYPIIKNWG
jgi:hypothetical protein